MIVLTAATPWESKPLATALGLDWQSEGRWSGTAGPHELLLIETGMGAQRTRAALATVDIPKGATLISTGLAGALQPELQTGDIAADLHGGPANTVTVAREAAERLKLGFHVGKYACVDKVVDPGEKKTLGKEQRCLAVDMESATVRAQAEACGGDFAVVRAILDELGDTLPEEAPPSDDMGALMSYAFSHISDMPLLLRTGRKQKRAMRALGRYLNELLPRMGTEAEDETFA
jgi:nucleoside phosphorylase